MTKTFPLWSYNENKEINLVNEELLQSLISTVSYIFQPKTVVEVSRP